MKRSFLCIVLFLHLVPIASALFGTGSVSQSLKESSLISNPLFQILHLLHLFLDGPLHIRQRLRLLSRPLQLVLQAIGGARDILERERLAIAGRPARSCAGGEAGGELDAGADLGEDDGEFGEGVEGVGGERGGES